jgi:sugar O-acyltransferase (sialic acid O-acetyltransferase NeuD family)
VSRRLGILGTAGLATEVHLVAQRVNDVEHQWDDFFLIGPDPSSVPDGLVYGGSDADILEATFECDIAVGIGDPSNRASAVAPYLAQEPRFGFPTLIHPRAVIEIESDRIHLGRGNVICAGSVFTCDVRVGDFNYFNLNTTVGHGAVIGSYNVVNPGSNLSGGVTIGDRVLIGTGVQILEGLQVSDDAVVGAGALVNRPVVQADTVVGVPARSLDRR